MPTIDDQCRQCGRTFGRVAFRGERAPAAEGPKCRSPETELFQGPEPLFDDRTGFGGLDRNRD